MSWPPTAPCAPSHRPALASATVGPVSAVATAGYARALATDGVAG